MDPETPDTETLAFFHAVPVRRIAQRAEAWERDVRAAPPETWADFWREKADAVEALDTAGHLWVEDPDRDPQPDELTAELRRRASAADRLAHIAGASPGGPSDQAREGRPEWVQLAEPSRANDKWGPLIPLLDYALQTAADLSSDGTLRRLAEVCRDHPQASQYCAEKGIDIVLQVPMAGSTLSRLKKDVEEFRRSRERDPSII